MWSAQHWQRRVGGGGLDHIVDKAAAGGDEGVGKFLTIFLRARVDRGLVLEVGAKDDLDRAFWAHDRDLGRGPGEIDVAAQIA